MASFASGKFRLYFAVLSLVLLLGAGMAYVYNDRMEAERKARVQRAIIPNDMLSAADASKGKEISIYCAACHTFDKNGANRVGPNLFGVVGANIATKKGYAYTEALVRLQDKTWTTDEIYEWLRDPSAYAPGTLMTGSMLDPQDRMDLIAYLITLQ